MPWIYISVYKLASLSSYSRPIFIQPAHFGGKLLTTNNHTPTGKAIQAGWGKCPAWAGVKKISYLCIYLFNCIYLFLSICISYLNIIKLWCLKTAPQYLKVDISRTVVACKHAVPLHWYVTFYNLKYVYVLEKFKIINYAFRRYLVIYKTSWSLSYTSLVRNCYSSWFNKRSVVAALRIVNAENSKITQTCANGSKHKSRYVFDERKT